ncbi:MULTISPECIES: sugar ABC transporter substrate-binding protein [Rhizobium/Agrobacterium group]|jgi:multiple sugar transport system substrate-binding protein|uniref:Sugar ABC transporter substrate-binding protein n=2 Tax=Rhizobium/Agrobacterium group TaxID=227290 RepID=A0A546Y1K2_AGRTU|nr:MULTISPECIES: sugar ABC transporter substrate-binding protein [Rhizobium/Agrobacterium group]MBB4404286.1 multiple sugar transport system substrate-binding protein [Agrobacterium radiobacter]MBB5590537.1 multiple sugar transport system substrate-binding protein [Agrobacterium radiobacter]MBO0126089.1 sugar ABC transporter substrate-binding protein [Agrobacterium sp. OT33]MCZ4071652.1 sugar ABC transporter substrate-binding protein [Agrobacterium sp. LMR679]MCZ7483592.1 sugar ABC transporter
MKKLVTAAIFTALMTGTALADTTLKLVEVITSPERTETLKGIVSKFEAANPGTKVEIISLPWSEAFQKFATMVSAGDVPDVMEMPDTWLSLYANNGMLESLEPYLAKWEHTAGLSERTLELGRDVKDTAYMLPYGFYLRAMFYNKKLLAEAGVKEPPKTLEEFADASKKVAALPGKSGYCLRGGPGGLNGWVMFGASMAGSNEFFTKDGTSTFDSPGWVKGLTYVIDLYKNGYAPKDSVNWGFNEIVAGFYSGTCAFLDQDPDALIAIAQRMKPEDFGVMTMPKGPDGKTFPTIGFAGWSMMSKSENKDLSWKLIETLEGPEGNIEWNKKTGALPVHKSAEKDPFYASEQFKGWFDELADKNAVPTTMPTYLEEFAFFKDSLVIKTSQEALLGDITPEDLAKQWADYMTKAQQKFLASK